MDKKLEEAIKFLKNFISLFYEFPNPQSVSIKDSEIKNVETVLNYIDNSISTEVIEEKIKQIQQEYSKLDKEVDEYINDSNKDLTKYYENKLKIDTMQILSWVIEIFEELLEGK